jgi:hypothetical protein
MNKMKELAKLFLGVLALFAGASLSAQSVIQISIIRTTLDSGSFTALSNQLESTVNQFETGVTGFNFSVATSADRIDFNYTFPNGYDYDFWRNWRDVVVANLNANTPDSAGYRWEVSVDGQVSDDTNPLAGASWLPDATLIGDQLIFSETFGYIAAPNLDAENGFWGYFYNVNGFEWAWVVNGFYFNASNKTWYFNAPGSNWFFEYSPGGGQWVFYRRQN